MQAALVELVEDEEPDTVERRIVLEESRQHALGDDLESRARRNAGVVADTIPHPAPDLLA